MLRIWELILICQRSKKSFLKICPKITAAEAGVLYHLYRGQKGAGDRISLRKDFYRNADIPIDLEATVFTAETDDIIGEYIIFCRVLDDQIKKLGRTKEAAMEADGC